MYSIYSFYISYESRFLFFVTSLSHTVSSPTLECIPPVWVTSCTMKPFLDFLHSPDPTTRSRFHDSIFTQTVQTVMPTSSYLLPLSLSHWYTRTNTDNRTLITMTDENEGYLRSITHYLIYQRTIILHSILSIPPLLVYYLSTLLVNVLKLVPSGY